ncbi:MAG: ribbon-helix-helix protein, CopG family [Candidatus Levybacteria bacterium]|nr:ribbon-helix-helix protein, CopG family [Candidatus Levybacteria bacterium]
MQTQRSIINISVPRKMEIQIQKVAKEENRTISELLREAFRRYEFARDWAKIKAVGRATALRMGIKSDEDVERIAG